MKFFRRKKKTPEPQDAEKQPSALEPEGEQPPVPEPESDAPAAEADEVQPTRETKPEPETQEGNRGWFARIRQGLSRTGSQFGEGMGRLLFGKKEIDDELLEEIETHLLMADVGVDTTAKIVDDLTQKVARKQLADGEALYAALRQSLADILIRVEGPLDTSRSEKPFVLLVVGVNGVGKTTTIGKLARRFQDEGKSVMLAAGDTFRAAAVEQLKVWGERNNVPVVAQATGSDSASVIYDALQSARSRGTDILIADTAGRLHTKSHLMDELAKVKRVMGKLDSSAPHEILLVLDAGTGQNALNQAEQFIEAVGVTGIALTKLDGTAKGGVIFALSDRFGLPIRYIGVGEAVEDLQTFQAAPFVDALFASAEKQNNE
ncbi:signal recognition particle-docking protein FtsY [Gilvimarinus sp. F26214L]|uniref:signal recognition particle-docking protein FtsY n=1 Tax=Gilvimarinus sp. DZF01 TaxID=3461371 RepID=UPI00404662A4